MKPLKIGSHNSHRPLPTPKDMRLSPVLLLACALFASPSYAQQGTLPTDDMIESTTQDLDLETVEEVAVETNVDVEVKVEVDSVETSNAALVDEKEEKVRRKERE